ncbi:MAG: hypothetical protein LBT14_07815 [Treponema sp.]|nr:hypothetical protein [Treponema sp.]
MVAQTANTLTCTGGQVTGNTRFSLAPVGTGPGTLRYAVNPPEGLTLDGAGSKITIEQDGAVLASLNGEGFTAGVLPVSGAVTGALSLARGRYTVEILLAPAGENTAAVYREAVVIMPGMVTEIAFRPEAGDFLDPEARAVLTTGGGVFAKTRDNSSHTSIRESGGSDVNRTQTLYVPHWTPAAYFTFSKTAAQRVSVGGVDAGRVTLGSADTVVQTDTLQVFTVDTTDIAETGGERIFTLTLSEAGKSSVTWTVTIPVPYLTHLHYKALPGRLVYVQGEAFDFAGISLRGTIRTEPTKPKHQAISWKILIPAKLGKALLPLPNTA